MSILLLIVVLVLFLVLLSVFLTVPSPSHTNSPPPPLPSDPTFDNINVINTTSTKNLISTSSQLGDATGNSFSSGNNVITPSGGVFTNITADTFTVSNVFFGRVHVGTGGILNDGDYSSNGGILIEKDVDAENIIARGNSSITGNESVGGTFHSTGAATFGSGVNVTGNSSIAGNESVGGTFHSTGAATFGSGVNVTGNSSVSGNESVGGNFTSTGPAQLNSTLGVAGATTLSSTLAVSGASSFTGNVTANVVSSTNLAASVALNLPQNVAVPTAAAQIQYNSSTLKYQGSVSGGWVDFQTASNTEPPWTVEEEFDALIVTDYGGINHTVESVTGLTNTVPQCVSSEGFAIFTGFRQFNTPYSFVFYNVANGNSTIFTPPSPILSIAGYVNVACYGNIVTWIVCDVGSTAQYHYIGVYDSDLNSISPESIVEIQPSQPKFWMQAGPFPSYNLVMTQNYIAYVEKNPAVSGGYVRLYFYTPENYREVFDMTSRNFVYNYPITGSSGFCLYLTDTLPTFLVTSESQPFAGTNPYIKFYSLNGAEPIANESATTFSFSLNGGSFPAITYDYPNVNMAFDSNTSLLHVILSNPITPSSQVGLSSLTPSTAVVFRYNQGDYQWALSFDGFISIPVHISYSVYCSQVYYTTSSQPTPIVSPPPTPQNQCDAPNGYLGKKIFCMDGKVYISYIDNTGIPPNVTYQIGYSQFTYSPGSGGYSVGEAGNDLLTQVYASSTNLILASRTMGVMDNYFNFTNQPIGPKSSQLYWVSTDTDLWVFSGTIDQTTHVESYQTPSLSVTGSFFVNDSAIFKLPLSRIETLPYLMDGGTFLDVEKKLFIARLGGEWYSVPMVKMSADTL